MKRRQFVILDRDGTIIVERHYLSDPRQIEILPGAVRGLRQLLAMGLGLIIVTNQSAVGRGFFDEAHLDLIHRRLCELLKGRGNPDRGNLFLSPPTRTMIAPAASRSQGSSSERPMSLILIFKRVL